ncbi:MAG: acetyltransferase [Candidatus Competibacter sp.]
MKFFIKQPLIWVPLLGGAWWALDFPFMKRHSAAYLVRHPEARDQDWTTARRMCERFRDTPTTILNFLEGTRFRPDKRARQRSPYRHLLRPKSGGLASVLEAMPERLHTLLDVTIVYPDDRSTFLDLFSGRIRRVIVRVRPLPIPAEAAGRRLSPRSRVPGGHQSVGQPAMGRQGRADRPTARSPASGGALNPPVSSGRWF